VTRALFAVLLLTPFVAGSPPAVDPFGDNAPNCVIGPATVVGTEGSDVITGTPRHDIIAALGGNDTIVGNGGDDTVCGGAGDDTITTRDVNTRTNLVMVLGEEGNDTVTMLGAPTGKSANYFASGGPGDDRIDCGSANNSQLDYAEASRPVVVDLAAGAARGEGRDTFKRCGGVQGSRFSDVLLGTARRNGFSGDRGDDRISARGGDDVIFPGAGNDRVDGGTGVDHVIISGSQGATVNLRNGHARGEGIDTLRRLERVDGTTGPDVLVGDANANVLIGDDGNDRLFGGGGRDSLDGRAGFDFADGGAGRDSCRAEERRRCP
jgi:Ca2+-binding RTX toxin-like protein